MSATFAARALSPFPGLPELLPPVAGGPLTGRIEGNIDRTWKAWTPRVAIDYSPVEDIMFYASASRGFKGGGFTGQNGSLATISRTFNPEFAWNYELGLRSRFLDNRAQVNATLYQMDYSNLQFKTLIVTSRVTDYAATSRIRGLAVDRKST